MQRFMWRQALTEHKYYKTRINLEAMKTHATYTTVDNNNPYLSKNKLTLHMNAEF
jgi:hypothetical protein